MRARKKIQLSIAACVLALIVAELLAAAWLHWLADEQSFRRYASIGQLTARYGAFDRFRAHRHLGYALSPNYQAGTNRHNALGYRGEEIAVEKPAGMTRIVCIGGSTTYGYGVDDFRFTVPGLLQYGLREAGKEVEVVNAGCPGWSTFETLLNFESRVLDLSPDYVVFYHGINDVLASMVWPPEALRGDQSGWLVRDQRMVEASLLERSDLARIVMVRGGWIEPHSSMLRVIGDASPSNYTFEFRRQRKLQTYPDGVFREAPIEQMLRENGTRLFRRNLESLLAVAEAHGVSVLLTTFAYSEEFPGNANIGHPAVRAAVDACNDVVRETARRRGLGLVDLQPALRSKELFTDGEHFTVAGNVKRTELLSPYFLKRL
ncbi:MAG: SGNH/GDSL hydrolase family protein [Planctomycetota bacterium]|nr:SGNH/GDSL hydrolase family protein [Planctomycetota bacterium]MEC8652577.1 SGNH/GDSL hydrolase family protein [Planctomycetota bacterium]MEC9049136.1 SGNH/GDSL hydrolase family protein [Planctomycetota bacterium]